MQPDLPFIPHVDIANTPQPAACKTIVDELNTDYFEIRGRVDTLDVIGYDGETVWTSEHCPLPAPGA